MARRGEVRVVQCPQCGGALAPQLATQRCPWCGVWLDVQMSDLPLGEGLWDCGAIGGTAFVGDIYSLPDSAASRGMRW